MRRKTRPKERARRGQKKIEKENKTKKKGKKRKEEKKTNITEPGKNQGAIGPGQHIYPPPCRRAQGACYDPSQV